ncbi:carboxymuconolactone decarboxylase family protein [Streptomyces sp. NPDC015232]|uniref:carboxymuconolactone decarboxylase family protein n=1 Tax=unclassified Streptomyces TaxID=2593676 RepID=UPI0036FFE371
MQTHIQARMKNPAYVLPDGLKGIGSVFKAVAGGGLAPELQEIVALRASQINGCSACVHAHHANLVKAGESTERIASVAAWREAPFYDEAERAALALTEAVTRLADRSGEAVDDALWDEVTRHFDERQTSALLLLIGVTNMFNRLNAAIREPAGTTWG